mgnify:CR=1 FL=1
MAAIRSAYNNITLLIAANSYSGAWFTSSFSAPRSLIISAAAEGVGALKSDTKSHIVKSVS